jgi:hypothetical protein
MSRCDPRPAPQMRSRQRLMKSSAMRLHNLIQNGFGLRRLSPSTAVADIVEMRARAQHAVAGARADVGHARFDAWCIAMDELTGEPRWRLILEIQAERLLGDLMTSEDGPLGVPRSIRQTTKVSRPHAWLCGQRDSALAVGVVVRRSTRSHRQRRATHARANAWRSEIGTSWRATVGHDKPPGLCQHCHGAPGMVTTFAEAPFASPELDGLLRDAGQFRWAAGPLAKGSNLCHGTGGNG